MQENAAFFLLLKAVARQPQTENKAQIKSQADLKNKTKQPNKTRNTYTAVLEYS